MRESARATRESLGISPPHGKITTPNSAFSRARRRDLDARDRAFAAASRIRERFSRSGESAVATRARAGGATPFFAADSVPMYEEESRTTRNRGRPSKHPRKLSRQGFFSFPLSARPRAASLPKTRPVPTRSTDAPPLNASPHRAVQHGGRILPELLPGWPRPRARVRGQVRVAAPPPRQMKGLLSRRVSYFPLRPNDTNDNDETECVRGAPRPGPPPPPATPHRA